MKGESQVLWVPSERVRIMGPIKTQFAPEMGHKNEDKMFALGAIIVLSL